ncbi:hypothetical protein M404DRAFT_991659 [Pisolithus tinctorius Marx 270]|uniref:Uncharacterized protein n=1 Tax=Pisolithus tinctorius Marx 270 TaxID=870435 RepID=A0A0C3PYW0_PISTI|nr:hypothetical protein M404DRAFT_991659 [Pisolithus tinctorius Marx 270]
METLASRKVDPGRSLVTPGNNLPLTYSMQLTSCTACNGPLNSPLYRQLLTWHSVALLAC